MSNSGSYFSNVTNFIADFKMCTHKLHMTRYRISFLTAAVGLERFSDSVLAAEQATCREKLHENKETSPRNDVVFIDCLGSISSRSRTHYNFNSLTIRNYKEATFINANSRQRANGSLLGKNKKPIQTSRAPTPWSAVDYRKKVVLDVYPENHTLLLL